MERILVLGSGGHAASLVDAIERGNKYKVAGYIVNDRNANCCIDYPVIGADKDLVNLYRSGIRNAAVGIGYLGKSDLREKIYRQLKHIGFCMPVICDPSAIVSNHVEIGEGTFIGKGAIINAGALIGKMCIINSGAVIEHECQVNDFSHISIKSVLCGEVNIGRAAFIGANATIIQGKMIGKNCIVGAGATVRKNIGDGCMVWCKETFKCMKGGG